jgi:hypothetical protein
MSTTLSKLDSARAKLKSISESAKATMGTVLQTAEVAGTAFGMAYARGRFGTVDKESGHVNLEMLGVPLGLAGAVIMHGLGFAGALGKEYSEHGHNVGDGMLAEHLSITGFRMGGQEAVDANAKDAETGRPGPAIAGVGRRPAFQQASRPFPGRRNPAAAYARAY